MKLKITLSTVVEVNSKMYPSHIKTDEDILEFEKNNDYIGDVVVGDYLSCKTIATVEKFDG